MNKPKIVTILDSMPESCVIEVRVSREEYMKVLDWISPPSKERDEEALRDGAHVAYRGVGIYPPH